MTKLMKCLDFLNVLDYAGKLSITNVALIALLVKVMFAPNMDWPSIVALVTCFANYAHKRTLSQDASADEPK